MGMIRIIRDMARAELIRRGLMTRDYKMVKTIEGTYRIIRDDDCDTGED
jgi:hypothetical protein